MVIKKAKPRARGTPRSKLGPAKKTKRKASRNPKQTGVKTPSVACLVVRFIDKVPHDCMFSTRDLLHIDGVTRGALDQALYRAVKKGKIMRVGNGIFLKRHPNSKKPFPSPRQIAAVKARAYGKKLFVHGTNAKRAIPGYYTVNSEMVYGVAGSSTSFNTIWGRIHFKKYGERKLALGDTKVGQLIRALWELGKDCVARIAGELIQRLNAQEKLQLKRAARLMPAWMSDIFVPGIRSQTMLDKFIPVQREDWINLAG